MAQAPQGEVPARPLPRREFLKFAGLGGLALSTAGVAYLRTRGGNPGRATQLPDPLDPKDPTNFNNPIALPSDAGLLGILEPSSPFTITAKSIDHEIIPGKNAKLLVYEVNRAGKAYQNPILRVRKNGEIRATLKNELKQETIIHWHGLRVDTENDGHPHHVIAPGATYPYQFNIINRAGTYWYHPHPHGIAAEQLFRGLTSFLIVEDEEEEILTRALDLELGKTDIPLLLQDRQFGSDGSLLYAPRRNDYFTGVLGDVILVNNTVKPYLDVSSRVYRFRVLNGSNSRNYRLAFLKNSDRLPFYIIGNDGGLLDKPYRAQEVTLSSSERVDILLDLKSFGPGDVIFLKSLGVDLGTMEGMADMHRAALRSEDEFYLLKLNLRNRVSYDKPIPGTLSEIVPLQPNVSQARPFTLSFNRTQWYINDLQFKMDAYPVVVNRDSVEIWEIRNAPASMPHPMHIHGYPFQVLERLNSPKSVRDQAVDTKGLNPTDKGWKDSVLVWPGETVRFAVDFHHPFPGDQIYLFHCHILEHSDQGMMINYKVV